MPVIKRYPNRKLYDTETKQYITLDGIAEMIRRGEEVQVIDNASGVDLTAVTLSQIVFDQEKKKSGFLPRSVLAGLIQSGGDRLGSLQRGIFASLGFRSLVDNEIRRRVLQLVDQGELPADQAVPLLEKLLSAAIPVVEEEEAELEEREHIFPAAQEWEERLLSRLQIPSQKNMQELVDQIKELEQKIDELEGGKS